MRQCVKVFILILIVFLTSALKPSPVSAQAGTPTELINTVNALRQSQGLAPYTVDGFLMDFAQTHSEYMASLGTWTHTRADGSSPANYGIKENVAMGINMTVQYCVYTVWSDWAHWQTMTAYTAGSVGAGVAVSGDKVYYTLNVLPGGEVFSDDTTDSEDSIVVAVSQQLQETPIPILPVATATPDEDGIIIHTVQYGETLWTISQAYDVPIDQILRNSAMSLTTTAVLEGQELIIQTATEATPTVSPTVTEIPPTPTATQPRPTLTPFPTRTPAPTLTPTQPPSFVHQALGHGKTVGVGLILVSGLGLILVIYFGFIKKS